MAEIERVPQMAGDLAEFIGEHLQHDEMWHTDDDVDEYVISHVLRLSPDDQRRMRAIATTLMGLTASALARAGTAPRVQDAITDNPDLAVVHLHIVDGKQDERG